MTDKKQIKKSNIAIIIIVAVLIAAVAILAVINNNQNKLPETDGSLLILSGNETLKEYTFEELKALPSVDIEKTITLGKNGDESGTFTGVPLEVILNEAAPNWQSKYTEFIFKASDGYTSSAFASDVTEGENVLVVYAKDGDPLRSEQGKLRIVIVSDTFGTRSAYLLTSIELAE
jgi:DMSO/TMAO reductase YedYZ molybdopterin-dependent catalytic subunit